MRNLCRRRFVATLAAAVPLAGTPLRGLAKTAEPRLLNFSHLHTGESLKVEYFSAGDYQPDALQAVNHLLRDFRTGDVAPIDRRLLDLLHALSLKTGSQRPFQIISGYRSPATNRMLNERSRGVATRSLHMTGQAIDIRLSDVPLARLRDAARAAGLGGVGYYPISDFVHVDTGRVRAW